MLETDVFIVGGGPSAPAAAIARRWAALERSLRDSQRIAYRRHYEVAPWTGCVEIHWGDGRQFYVTPVLSRSEFAWTGLSLGRRILTA